MPFEQKEFGENKPLAHTILFRVSDTSKDLVRDFIDLCTKYLSRHPGQEYYSIGYRALEMERPVNAKNFEVHVHMVFKDLAAYQAYTKTKVHDDFITHTAGMSPDRIVCDAFLHSIITETP